MRGARAMRVRGVAQLHSIIVARPTGLLMIIGQI